MTGRMAIVPLLAVGATLLAASGSPVPATGPRSAAPPVSLAATALIMGGTFDELSIPQDTPEFIGSYVGDVSRVYVDPTGMCSGGEPACTPLALYTPEQFRLLTGFNDLTFDDSVAAGVANLDACLRGSPCVTTAPPYTVTRTAALTDSVYTVVGYSQSATVATEAKRALIAEPPSVSASFVLIANPNRPNGGILERFAGAYIPLAGVSFNGATPTDSPAGAPLTTVDVVRQYDLMADFPTNPLNLIADLNAVLGYYVVHLQPFDFSTAELQGQYQDSTYYLVPTTTLPLLAPIAQIPWVGPLVSALLDPPLRVLVESAYHRAVNPGTPTPAQWLYVGDPLATALHFAQAIPTGWDNAIAYVTGDPGNRPFGTTPQAAYGVGGPPVNAGAIDPYGPPTPYQPPSATLVTAASRPAATNATVIANTATPLAEEPMVQQPASPNLRAGEPSASEAAPVTADDISAPATPPTPQPVSPRSRQPRDDSVNSPLPGLRGHRNAGTGDADSGQQHRGRGAA